MCKRKIAPTPPTLATPMDPSHSYSSPLELQLQRTPMDSTCLQSGWWTSLPKTLNPIDYIELNWSPKVSVTNSDSNGLLWSPTDSICSQPASYSSLPQPLTPMNSFELHWTFRVVRLEKVLWFTSKSCSYSYIIFPFKVSKLVVILRKEKSMSTRVRRLLESFKV